MRFLKRLSLVAAFAGAIWFAYAWRDHLDPQGESNSSCAVFELPISQSTTGLVASAHETACDVFGGNWAVYVHVRKPGEPESRRTLVFRYSEPGDSDLPKIKWVADTSLFISVSHVAQVTKQLSHANGASITYSIGKEDYARP
jgi:hypothetical protein